eukprot:m.21060 g.21060  ORF g.21060 m.21060 type:complete len:134 (-) comp12290_c0_seq2:172-573(-)
MFYSESDGAITSVTVSFGIHIDGSGNQRDAFIQVKCDPDATQPYKYSTIGDQGHPSQYEIDVTAPCDSSEPPSPSYTCWNNTCVGSLVGVPINDCQAACKEPVPITYICKDGKTCVPSSNGGTLEQCQAVCHT